MNLNLNIPEEHGEVLDALAKEGHRSRRSQARKILMEAIDKLSSGDWSRSVSQPHQDKEAGQ